jgi:DNA modification methylase
MMLEGWGFKSQLIGWKKKYPAPPPPGAGWPSALELCLYAFKGGRIWNPRPGDPPHSNVLEYDSYRNGMPGKVRHPTQKPLNMFSEIILYSSNLDSLILDPFLGSGTTAVAAKQLSRKFIGIEIEEKYCAIAKQRLAQEQLL